MESFIIGLSHRLFAFGNDGVILVHEVSLSAIYHIVNCRLNAARKLVFLREV